MQANPETLTADDHRRQASELEPNLVARARIGQPTGRARVVVTAGIFLVLGGLATGVGLHNLLGGRIIDLQLYAAAIAVTGMLMLAAAAGMVVERWRDQWGRSIALLAGLVSAALGVSLFMNQFPYLDGARALLPAVWAGWIIASVLAVLLRPAPRSGQGLRGRDSETRGFWLTAVATLSSLGIGASLVFNVVQFALSQVSAGSTNNGYGLSVSEQLVDDGPSTDGQFHHYSVHVTLKNPGGAPLQVLRSTYAILGRNLSRASATSDADFSARLVESRLAGTFSSRFSSYEPRQLLEEGEMLYTASRLGSGQELAFEFEVAIPQDQALKYDYLRLETNFIVARGDRLVVSAHSPQSIGACSSFGVTADYCVLTEWPITSPGWLWTLTKGRQKVETLEGLRTTTAGSTDQAAWLGLCIVSDVGSVASAGAVCEPSPRDDYFSRFFELGYLAPVVYETPVTPIRQR